MMIGNDHIYEAIVVGAGPAGMSLAIALADVGIEVLCIAPRFDSWLPNYGVWVDEVKEVLPRRYLSHCWPNVRVETPARKARDFGREYGRLDNELLFSDWHKRLCGMDATREGRVLSALFEPNFTRLRLDSGPDLLARVVIDASGHSPALVRRRPTSPAWQVAYGLKVERKSRTTSCSTMGLMKWDVGRVLKDAACRTPAFLYEMPDSAKVSFVEMTVLASRPRVDLESVKSLLLSELGSEEFEVLDVERCIIPMGYIVPDLEQRIVGFGGAASMVHPATGYMVGRCFRRAPKVAEAVMALRGESPASASRALWEVVWPADEVRTHELHRFGLEAMLKMSPEEIWAFFDAFFDLPQERWAAYLSGTAPPEAVARTMWEVFWLVDPKLKARLARTAVGPHLGKLLRMLG